MPLSAKVVKGKYGKDAARVFLVVDVRQTATERLPVNVAVSGISVTYGAMNVQGNLAARKKKKFVFMFRTPNPAPGPNEEVRLAFTLHFRNNINLPLNDTFKGSLIDPKPDSRTANIAISYPMNNDQVPGPDFYSEGTLGASETLGDAYCLDDAAARLDPDWIYEEPGYWCCGYSIAKRGFYEMHVSPYNGSDVVTNFEIT
ncbi:MAG: hypothetical protein K2X38_21535 [Gemmataceae bacterium]|nr:hypothetical protein [Gemmataceae bacterium]